MYENPTIRSWYYETCFQVSLREDSSTVRTELWPSLAPIRLFSYIIIQKNISFSAIFVYRFRIHTDSRHFAFLYDAFSHVDCSFLLLTSF